MRKVWPAVALLCTSLLSLVFLAELVLRWSMGKPVHFQYPQPRYVYDVEMCHWLKPNQRSLTHEKPVVVNSIGIREVEYSREPAPGTHRILAEGDSQTFGNGLAEPDTWTALLEQQLNGLGQGPWQVVNGGVAGTDTWQHAHIVWRLAEPYTLDGVVLAFHVNDVNQRYPPTPDPKITNTWAKRTSYVLKRSAVLSLLWGTYQGFTMSWDEDHERSALTGEPSATAERSWEEVERSSPESAQLTEELDVGVLLVVLPHRSQVTKGLDAVAHNEQIATVARQRGTQAIDVLLELREAYARDGGDFFVPRGWAQRLRCECSDRARAGGTCARHLRSDDQRVHQDRSHPRTRASRSTSERWQTVNSAQNSGAVSAGRRAPTTRVRSYEAFGSLNPRFSVAGHQEAASQTVQRLRSFNTQYSTTRPSGRGRQATAERTQREAQSLGAVESTWKRRCRKRQRS